MRFLCMPSVFGLPMPRCFLGSLPKCPKYPYMRCVSFLYSRNGHDDLGRYVISGYLDP